MRSFTIHIEKNLSLVWDKILTNHSLDREENGLHWKVLNYTDGKLTGNIAIGKWHIPKKDGQSKLNIQSNEKGNFLPAHFVDHVLPTLLEEVHKYKGIELQDPGKEPALRKANAGKLQSLNCELCKFVGNTHENSQEGT